MTEQATTIVTEEIETPNRITRMKNRVKQIDIKPIIKTAGVIVAGTTVLVAGLKIATVVLAKPPYTDEEMEVVAESLTVVTPED